MHMGFGYSAVAATDGNQPSRSCITLQSAIVERL